MKYVVTKDGDDFDQEEFDEEKRWLRLSSKCYNLPSCQWSNVGIWAVKESKSMKKKNNITQACSWTSMWLFVFKFLHLSFELLCIFKVPFFNFHSEILTTWVSEGNRQWFQAWHIILIFEVSFLDRLRVFLSLDDCQNACFLVRGWHVFLEDHRFGLCSPDFCHHEIYEEQKSKLCPMLLQIVPKKDCL